MDNRVRSGDQNDPDEDEIMLDADAVRGDPAIQTIQSLLEELCLATTSTSASADAASDVAEPSTARRSGRRRTPTYKAKMMETDTFIGLPDLYRCRVHVQTGKAPSQSRPLYDDEL